MKMEQTSYTINKVVPFKESVQEYLRSGVEGPEKHVADQLALLNGGVLTDMRYSWLSNGSKFEVIRTKTGSKVAAWNFGAVLHDFDTIVACVTDLPSVHGKPPIVVLGIDCELTGGMICFFDINSSRVIRAIQIDDKVSSIHVVNAGNDLSLPGALRALDGVLAIGTHRGKVLLMDICRQICDEAILNTADRVKDEMNSCHLTCLSLCDLEHLEYHKERSLKNEDHICIQLNPQSTSGEHFALHGPDKEIRLHANMVEVAISALFYCPQLGSLLVGFNFGAFQLYNLSNMQLIYTSPVYEDCIPITHFAVQEPCDDPRAYCYVWVVYNTIEKDDKTFPMAVMYAFAYNNKDYLEGYGHLYQDFVSCSVRFQMELTSVPGPKNAVGAKCLSLQSYSKALAPRQGPAPFVDAPEEKLALCNIVWMAWNSQNAALVETYFCLFDLNQWYKEQMPASTQLATDTDCNSYISCVSLSTLLSPVSEHSYNNQLLDIRINPNTFCQFVCAQRLEEHYFPSALAFQGVISRGNDCVWFSNSGVQRHLLMQLEVVGSLGLIRPTELFQRCLDLGLTPIYTDMPYGRSASTSLKIQRELILSVALEHQLVRWLCQCGHDWANGSQSGAGCTLDLLLHWAWQRANVLKFQSDKLCIPLFDHTGSRLDANAIIQLNHCACQLKNLTILFEHVSANFTMYYSEQDIADIRYQTQSLQMISTHLEVLHWLLNVGLLPECPLSMYPLSDEAERVSAPYPAEKLSTFYKCKRQEFYHLQNPNEEEILSQEAFKTSCDLLFIDNLIDLECKGVVLKKQWKSDCGNGLYPPPSLQALLRAYFIEDIDIVHKHCLFVYMFLDLAMTLDQSRYKSIIPHLIKFPAVFKINPSIIKITQAFWQLDHGDFSTAMTQLLDPSVNNEDLKPWHHRTLLKALLIQGQHQHALLYQQVRKPPVSSIQDICITTTLLIVNDLVQEAFHFQRQHRSVFNEKEILLHFFQTCNKMNQLPLILHLPLSRNEEQEFLSYLKTSSDTKVKSLLVVFYLQRAQYGDAFAANDLLNNYVVMKQGLLGQQDGHFRNVVISGFRRTLPTVTQCLLDFCKKNHPKMSSLINVNRPNPMSVYIHDATEHAKYKSTLIQASFLKAKETWKQSSNVLSLNETPFISTPKIATSLASPRMNSSLIYPAIVEGNNRNTTAEHDISEDATPAKRIRLSSRSSINNASLSLNLDTSMSRRTLSCYNSSSLLSTPIVKRRSYRSTSVASNILDSFAVDTPTSILKVRSFIRSSQSPETRGNSTTPEILEEDHQNSEAEIVVSSTAQSKVISLDTSTIKRRSSLRITPRKSISRTPRFGVHFEDGRRPNSRSSNESGENPDVQKMDVCIQVHREQIPEGPIADDLSVQIDSKNSSHSTDDIFYSPKQSLSLSDQKSSDVSAISSMLSEPKELSKISGVSSLESNSFDDKRSSLKRKASDSSPGSVRSRRSYRNSSTISQETTSPAAIALKTPEVVPKLAGRKSLTRQVLENNLKIKVLSTPSFKALFSPPHTDKDITISKNTTDVIIIHASGDVTEETHSVTTTETKNEVITTKKEQELQKIHNFNESFTKSVTKMSEMPENVVPTLDERSYVLSASSDVSESDVAHFYDNVSGLDISSTDSESEQQNKEEEVMQVVEQEEDEIKEKISDQSDIEEEQVIVDVVNEEQSNSDKVEMKEGDGQILTINRENIEEQSQSDKKEMKESVEQILTVCREEIEEQNESDKVEIEEGDEETLTVKREEIAESESEREDKDEVTSNSDRESEEEVMIVDVHELNSEAEENEEEEESIERLIVEEVEDSEAESSEHSSKNDEDEEEEEEDEESCTSENSSDVIEIKSSSDEYSQDADQVEKEEEKKCINAQLDDKLVDIERIDESSNEEEEEDDDDENVEEEEKSELFEMQNVSSGIYDDLDEIEDNTNVLERNITSTLTEDAKKNAEEREYLQYASDEVTDEHENRSLLNQDYEENMQAIEEVTQKEEHADDIVAEATIEGIEVGEENAELDENAFVAEQDAQEELMEVVEVVEENAKPHEDDFVAESVKEDAGEIMEGIEVMEENEEDEQEAIDKSVDLRITVVEEKAKLQKEEEVKDRPVGRIAVVEEKTEHQKEVEVQEVKNEPVQRITRKRSASVDVNIKATAEAQTVPTSSQVLRRLRSNSTDVEHREPTAELNIITAASGRSLRRTRSQSTDTTTGSTKASKPPRRTRAASVQLEDIAEDKVTRKNIRAKSVDNTADISRRNRRGSSLEPEMLVKSTKKRNLQADVIVEELADDEKDDVMDQELTAVPSKIEEYSATHRMTRRQKMIMEKNLEKSQALTLPTTLKKTSVVAAEEPADNIEHLGTPKKQRKTRRSSVNSSITSSPSSVEGTTTTASARPRRRSFTQAQQAINTPTSTRRHSSSKASSAQDADDIFSDTESAVSVPVAHKSQPPEERDLRHRSLSPSMLKRDIVASPRITRRSARGLVLPPKTDLTNITEEQSIGSAAPEEKAGIIAAKRGGPRKRDTAGTSHQSQSSQDRQSTARRTTYKPLETYLPQHAIIKTRKSYKFRKFLKSDPTK